jgi:hypothetical protein
MKAMNRTILAFVTLALLCVPMALIGQALDFSGWAWMGALVVVMCSPRWLTAKASTAPPAGATRRRRRYGAVQ